MKKRLAMATCPCGGTTYADCCEPLLNGIRQAASAVELMRSRYTAYSRCADDYLRATWAAQTRPTAQISQAGVQWLGLEVRAHSQEDRYAQVEFIARYKIDGRAHRLHEISRFVCEDGVWTYVDGSFPEDDV